MGKSLQPLHQPIQGNAFDLVRPGQPRMGDDVAQIGPLAAPAEAFVPVQLVACQKFLDRGLAVARPYLGDIAGRPVQLRRILGAQGNVPGLAARTARVQQPPFREQPVLGRPRHQRLGRSLRPQPVQLLGPFAHGGIVVVAVHAHDVEQAAGRSFCQPAIHPAAKAAEGGVVFHVAQRQHGIAQALERGRLRHLLAGESARGVGRFARAIGAGDDQERAGLGDLRHGKPAQRRDPDHPVCRQRIGAEPGNALGRPGLAGEGDQDSAAAFGKAGKQGAEDHAGH